MQYILPVATLSEELRDRIAALYESFLENDFIKKLKSYDLKEISHLQISALIYQMEENTLAAMGKSGFDDLVIAGFQAAMHTHSLIDCDPRYKQDTYLEDIFAEYFPWYNKKWDTQEDDNSFSGIFFQHIVDQLAVQCIDLLVNVVKLESSWRVWSITRVGRDICLEIGEDYRVIEWTRMQMLKGR